jgi:hypothetical protein
MLLIIPCNFCLLYTLLLNAYIEQYPPDKVLLLLGKAQFELRKLVDSYVSFKLFIGGVTYLP